MRNMQGREFSSISKSESRNSGKLSPAPTSEMKDTNVRRSTRLSRRIPILLTSLDPNQNFSISTETVVVNAHGFGIVLPEKLEKGSPVVVRLSSSGRCRNARVVLTITVVEGSSWLLGLEFDTVGANFWEIEDPPPDWLY